MDKKKQLQKQILTSKIQDNTNILLTLEKTYNDLLNTSNSNITVTNSNSKNIENLTILQKDKSTLEIKKKTIKQNINNLITTLSQQEQNLRTHPLINKEIYNNELTIYNDEHNRIDSDKLETINNNIENINKANLDKEQLLKDIELLKVNINLQSNIIINIQKECNISRHNILENLKDKKKEKQIINNNIENANTSVNIFTQKINNVNINIDNLIEFKTLLVNYEYNNSNDNDNDNDKIDDDTINKLTNYYSLYNIDSTILLNDKLIIIDDIIANNKNQIILFNKKLNRTKVLNNLNIKDNYNNYNNKNTCKVLTYKDKFKIEKEKKTQIENILNLKLYKYNNYQTLVIDKLNSDYKNKIDSLELDKINADKRLNVVRKRMNIDYSNKKKLLKNNIEKTKIEIENNNIQMQSINTNLKNITTIIEDTTILNNELYILENKIKKYKEIIAITEKDLNIINNQ